MRAARWVVGLLLVALVVAATAYALLGLAKDRRLTDRGSVTRGTVVRVVPRPGPDALLVRLDRVAAREATVSRALPRRAGEQVDVEFDPDDPSVARVAGTRADSTLGRRILVVEMLLGAAALTALAVRRTGRRARDSAPPDQAGR